MKALYNLKFTILSVILLVLLLVEPQVAEDFQGKMILAIITFALQLVIIIALSGDRVQCVWVAAFGLPAVIAVFASIAVPDESRGPIVAWSHGLAALFFVITALLILRYVLLHEVTVDHVVGALVAYLLIGVAMGQLYVVLEMQHPYSYHTSANIGNALDSPHSRSACLTYYSFVTLTTSGYGDIVPATPLTRNLAWMEAVAGQFYLAVLVAGLIGMRVSRTSPPRLPGET